MDEKFRAYTTIIENQQATITMLAGRMLEMQAAYASLASVAVALGKKLGVDPATVARCVENNRKIFHQRLLELRESESPGQAARMDLRELDDLGPLDSGIELF